MVDDWRAVFLASSDDNDDSDEDEDEDGEEDEDEEDETTTDEDGDVDAAADDGDDDVRGPAGEEATDDNDHSTRCPCLPQDFLHLHWQFERITYCSPKCGEPYRRSQNFVWGALFSSPTMWHIDFLRLRNILTYLLTKKLTFLVVALKTHAKTTWITSPTVHISPISSKKLDSCSASGCTLCVGVHLQLSPVNLAKKKISPPWGVHVHPVQPMATPTWGTKFRNSFSSWRTNGNSVSQSFGG